MLNYEPRPGSVPETVINMLRDDGPMRSSRLAKHLGKRAADMYSLMKAALRQKAVHRTSYSEGRVTVWHLPGQDPMLALSAEMRRTQTHASDADPEPDTDEPAASAPTRQRRRRQAQAEDEPPPEQQPDPLQISAWSDGDVCISGDELTYALNPDGEVVGVTLTASQIRQLVEFVARPVVALGA